MENVGKRIFASLLSLSMVSGLVSHNIKPVHASVDADTTIYIDSDQIVTNDFEGFGVQWDPSDLYSYTDEQWASFKEKAKFLKPNVMRVMLHDGDSYCIGFDENKKPLYDWNSPLMQRTYRILDFAQENNIPIMIGEWRSISERGYLSYDETGKEVSWDNPIWAEMIVDCLKHLINDKGYTCIKYYNMINEPNYYKRDHPSKTDQEVYDAWRQAIKNLRAKMDETANKQITKIKIVGPDVYDGQEAWIRQSTSDELKDIIELTEVHRYAPKSEVESGLIEEKLKSWKKLAETLNPKIKQDGFALGEMGLAGTGPGDCQLGVRNYEYGVDIFDYALQATRAGLKFGSVWGFEDSMHLQSTDVVTTFKDKYGPAATTEEGRQYKVHTPTGDPNIDNDIKIWGFWNELGEEMAAQNSANNVTGRPNTVQSSDEKIRPWYYTWSMFCRYFPAGMKILETTDSGIDAVRATAGLLPNGDKSDVSIAVVNSTGKEKTIELNVPNANGLVDLNQYFYYDGEINGKSRPVNEKGQVLPYGIIKDASLSKGVEVTLPANSCMILTSLGYNGESHPMSLTTGQKPDVNKVNIFEESGVQKLSVGETYQISTKFTPSISSADMEWKVTDYFGQPSSLATINEKGLLTVKKPGQFKVEGSVKGHPEIKDTITFIATSSKVLVDVFNVYDEPSVGKYENIVKDDKPSNFNNVQTVKRSDTNKPAYITYQADGIYDFEFDAYSLHSDLGKTDNFLVEASVDNQTWEKIECDYIAEAKLSTNWYKISVTDKAMDTTKNYQYLRITLQSHNGYKVYDPQYGGGSILYGDQGVSEIIIDNKEEFVVKGETLELSGSILPSSLSQDIEWSVVNLDGTPTTKASINNNVLTAKETGQVVIIAQPKDHSLSCYYPMNIVGGYIEDDIKNYDLMYDHGSFVYEGSSAKFDDKTIIKRTDDTPQSLVYSYNGIQKATFEVYSNGSVSDENVDIYVSKDGLHYEVLDKTITRIGPASPSNTEYQKYEVSAFTNSDEYNFIKFEVKNDSKVYRPMIGKVKIIYNPEDNAKTIDINVVNSLIKMNLGSETTLDVKIAPANSQPQLTYESLDESIASIDKNGKITAKKLGSTYVIARVNDQIYTRCVVNVYENFAYKKNVEVSGTYAGGDIALNATDGDYSTRWASLRNNNQYITVDLGKVQTIDTVKIFWEAARAKDYRIEVAGEDGQFKVVKEFKDMTANSLNDLITFDPMEARYVKMQGITPIGKYGYSIYEFEVYNNKNIVNVENIELSEDTKELYLNQDYELNIQVNPSQATYSLPVLSSSHENIVSIKDHRLKAVGVGEAIITVEADEKVTQLKVKVVKANAQKYADELDTLNIQDGKIVFPSHEGYTYSIYSTDHKKVISKDGIVHMPIKTTDVSLIVEVKGEKDVAYSKIIHVVINGNEDCLHHIEKLIADMKALDSHLYKPSTLKTLNDYIKATEDLLTQSDLLVDEVQEAHEQILSLYEKLEYKADRTTLDTLLKELSQLDKEFYTANSYQQLLNVIKDVQTQINDESSQEDIEKAIIQLQTAQKTLVKQSDYDLLFNKIHSITNEDLSMYTKKSVDELNKVLNQAKEYLNQETITTSCLYDYYYEVTKAYQALELKGDQTSLETFIEKIEKMDLSKYEDQGVQNLLNVIKDIKQQMKSDLSQTELNNLISKLENAYHQLVLKTTTDVNENNNQVATNDNTQMTGYMMMFIISCLTIALLTKKILSKKEN